MTAAVQRIRVLVLEDEWMIAEQIETALVEAGFEVVGPVGETDQALALLADPSVDMAVPDINLRGERSFEVAEALLRDAIPFVFLSGYLEADLPKAFQERPMMTKPVDVAGLSRCIDALARPR